MSKPLIIIVFLLMQVYDASPQISVHTSGSYLMEIKKSKPFFWLGDTGWELFHRITRNDVVEYLDVRQKQGFNLIQAVVLAENNGIITPNRYGDVPFKDLDPLKWDITPGNDYNNPAEYDYWDNVDYAINEAAKRNLYIGLLPTWGDKVAHMWGEGPVIFNENNAFAYAKKLAERYKNQWNIIWILGGDRPGEYEYNGKRYDDRSIWRAMARGIETVCGKQAFITYHPGASDYGSGEWFHKDSWLDMNAIQSGHGRRDVPVWDDIRKDLLRLPLKPVLDMEPCYEYHPVNPWDGKWTRKERGYFSPLEIRARMYRSVFVGACGVTYGHHSVWQFLDTALYQSINTGDTVIHWRDALHSDVARQMKHLKKLMLSRKDPARVEDSLLIETGRGSSYKDLVIATKNVRGSYALVYMPEPNELKINLDRLKAGQKKLTWFNPVNGKKTKVRKKISSVILQIQPPDLRQSDWVLIIDM